MKFWNKFLKLMTPFIKWWGKLHWPWTHKKINGDHYYLWRDDIWPGYVLLSSTKGEFSNLLNPSEINHGALYCGGEKIKFVLEALGRGVTKNNLVKFMTTKDVLIIIRPKFASEGQRFQVAKAAMKYQGKPYDYVFDKGDEALYCFELIAMAYHDVFPNKMLKCKEIVKGKRIYDSDTFLNDPDNWEIILDSREFFNKEE